MELLGIFGLLLGMAIGWFGREAYAKRVLRRLQMETLKYFKEIADNTVMLDVTEQNGEIFAYNKDTGSFVAQAKSIEDLIKHLSTRFPSTTFLTDRSLLLSIKDKNETL